MRAFLSQDPDVIMVGEVRDLETAEIAIKASANRPLGALDATHCKRRTADAHPPRRHGCIFRTRSRLRSASSSRNVWRAGCAHCKQPMDIPKEALLKEGFQEADVAAKVSARSSDPKAVIAARTATKAVWASTRSCLLLIPSRVSSWRWAARSISVHRRPGVWDLRRAGLESQGRFDDSRRSQQRHHRVMKD